MNCIFCKIIKGEIPAEKIYEDEYVIAMLDANPRAAGHTIVIPKIHVPTLFELPDDEIDPFFKAVKHVSRRIYKALHPAGLTMGLNHGEAGGQTVDHLHFHIIPRFEEDGGGSIQSVVNNPPERKLSEVAERIRRAGE